MAYEITDHLGNVRALLRDNISTYTATMEAVDNAVGPAISLRVNTGDEIETETQGEVRGEGKQRRGYPNGYYDTRPILKSNKAMKCLIILIALLQPCWVKAQLILVEKNGNQIEAKNFKWNGDIAKVKTTDKRDIEVNVQDILGYYLKNERIFKYLKRTDYGAPNAKVFLEKVTFGALELYKDHWYISNSSVVDYYIELDEKVHFLCSTNRIGQQVEEHRKMLISLISDAPGLVKKLEEEKFKPDLIVGIIQKYNILKFESEESTSEKKGKVTFYQKKRSKAAPITINAGGNMYELVPRRPISISLPVHQLTKVCFTVAGSEHCELMVGNSFYVGYYEVEIDKFSGKLIVTTAKASSAEYYIKYNSDKDIVKSSE